MSEALHFLLTLAAGAVLGVLWCRGWRAEVYRIVSASFVLFTASRLTRGMTWFPVTLTVTAATVLIAAVLLARPRRRA